MREYLEQEIEKEIFQIVYKNNKNKQKIKMTEIIKQVIVIKKFAQHEKLVTKIIASLVRDDTLIVGLYLDIKLNTKYRGEYESYI